MSRRLTYYIELTVLLELMGSLPSGMNALYRQSMMSLDPHLRRILIVALRWLMCSSGRISLDLIVDELECRWDAAEGSNVELEGYMGALILMNSKQTPRTTAKVKTKERRKLLSKERSTLATFQTSSELLDTIFSSLTKMDILPPNITLSEILFLPRKSR